MGWMGWGGQRELAEGGRGSSRRRGGAGSGGCGRVEPLVSDSAACVAANSCGSVAIASVNVSRAAASGSHAPVSSQSREVLTTAISRAVSPGRSE